MPYECCDPLSAQMFEDFIVSESQRVSSRFDPSDCIVRLVRDIPHHPVKVEHAHEQYNQHLNTPSRC